MQLNNLVLTNGCFDILHLGHVKYLEMASTLGRYLVVAVDSDLNVKRIKGENRPIQNQQTRLAIIQALKFVDFAFLFDGSMLDVLEHWRPLIYVKGGDYTFDSINLQERQFIESYGGVIHLIQTGITESTTRIYERCCNSCDR